MGILLARDKHSLNIHRDNTAVSIWTEREKADILGRKSWWVGETKTAEKTEKQTETVKERKK